MISERPLTVTLYSRMDCHLCEQARQDLEELRSEFLLTLVEVDVDSDPKLQREFSSETPAVAVGPYRLKAPFGKQELRLTLAAARDRERHIDMVEASPKLKEVQQRGEWKRSDSFSYWFSRHYMLVFNLMVLIYLGGAFLAPVLMKMGWNKPASWIYRGYSLVCHQLGYRSLFLFGERMVYPRAAAEVDGSLTFSEATNLGEGSMVSELLAARSYVGDDRIGYKIALCQRDTAIYFGILLFGLLFSLSRYRLPSLPWYIWITAGCIPIGIDGFSQILSQPPLSFLPYRESTPILRIFTGFLFGFTTAWFGYPVVEESMSETRKMYREKRQRLQLDFRYPGRLSKI